MKKIIVAITAVAVVSLGSPLFSTTTQAETVDALKSRQAEIRDDRSEIKANLSEAESSIADILIDLEELNKEIERVNDALIENQKKIDETESEIADTEEEVDVMEEEIVELEEVIEARYNILKERIVSYQRNGGNISYLEVVFGAKDFSDFVNRVSAVNKIADSDTKLMKIQEQDKKKVEEKQAEVIEKLNDLNEMKTEFAGMQVLIEEQREKNEERKETLKEKEENLITLKNELQLEDSNLALLESQVRENIAAATSPVAVQTSVAQSQSSGDNGGNVTTLSSKKESKPVVSKTSGSNGNAITAGNKYIGNSVYKFGGGRTASDIAKGQFDCSGFIAWAYAQEGISLPASTASLVNTGTTVKPSNMQPGDLVFFNTNGRNGHAGIYVGGGKFIGSQSSTGVAIVDMSSGYWAKNFSGLVKRVK
ncbi:NlpC/P60 family protein [Virgibacillus sp. C22-A2]|uniref:NlpC/P60 family protein n=1 Tax=Virgibacillus tibetensis TaxID=3042313 RepID=A0ABU6KIQ8_9BACI|nr:NlpC/P60 family protein [Virgibacillus sp. C22-A2]